MGASCRAPPRERRAKRSCAELDRTRLARWRNLPADGELVLNEGRETVQVKVTNRGDRPIQVGSHYHFARPIARSSSIAASRTAGASTFPPAPPCDSSRARRRPSRSSRLPAAGDSRRQRIASGPVATGRHARAVATTFGMRSYELSDRARHYADIYGPTTGDRVRLGDTDLVARGRTRRTRSTATSASSAAARCCATAWARPRASATSARSICVITNALIIDWTGIYKADVGDQERAHRRHRQGGQSRRDGRRHART